MIQQRFPYDVCIYKGENRYLVIPNICHVFGFRVQSEYSESFNEPVNSVEIGNCLFRCIEIIKNSPLDNSTPKERDQRATWKKSSKYKTYLSFWKNNNFSYFSVDEAGEYKITSQKRTVERKGGYNDCIKKILLPPTATAKELGEAVIDVFKASDEYYEEINK